MNIRRWEFTDLAAIAELEKACFADAWTYRQLADGFLSAGFVGYLAEDGGEIVGCAACQKAADEADLLRVAVSGSRRRVGIAGALLETLFAEALLTGVRTVFLEVRASNRPAVALYLKHGFTHVSLRKNYYGNEDAVVMKKEFCESD